MSRIICSDQAKASLRSILLFIGERDPDAALRLLDELQRRLDLVLTEFPEAGATAVGGQRFLAIRRHSVLYRHDAFRDEVLVLDVFGPGEDWR